jgi:hypothetical protein
MKYYHNNECNKFKHTYRKDTKLNEEDATVCFFYLFSLISSILSSSISALVVKRKSCCYYKYTSKCN